jgi:hypothetical protein
VRACDGDRDGEGEYDIVILSAKESGGLETWLRTNGYRIPRGASAALQPYVRQGLKFFVAKVNLAEHARTDNSWLSPLQFAFESDKFSCRCALECSTRRARRT